MNVKKWLLPAFKWVLMLCGAIYLVTLAATFFAARPSSSGQPDYQLAEVRRGSLETTVSSTGTLAAVGEPLSEAPSVGEPVREKDRTH